MINAALGGDPGKALPYIYSVDGFWVEQIFALARNTAFRKWREESGSKFLVVRNHETVTESSSFLSGVCYALSHEQDRGVRSIAFYCGQHLHIAGNKDLYQVLMLDLTLQLLEAFGQELLGQCGVNLASLRGQLHEKDGGLIRDVFRKALKCIRHGALSVFIDGIYHYQAKHYSSYGEYRDEEVRDAMRLLSELVQEANATERGVQLKVLVTNPTQKQQESWGIEAATITRKLREGNAVQGTSVYYCWSED
ncbi:hypothetical protein A9Z42_0003870 [Trichoderma parareesei]|uniref:Uncharacterized protein n=1 Tax=Trichoderma parareesei TaxID=858221 RepID=A0A2H3ACH3_TRIPA|nr:hypothetical protein A9Z42_0003870 [Trichoderma parareesei]